MVKFLKSVLNLNAGKPFKIIHVSDNHLTEVAEEDNDRKKELAEHRATIFPYRYEVLKTASEESKKENCPIVCTGDLIDFTSFGNFAAGGKFLAENDVLFIAGNHEFSQYVGEAKEDADYRNQSLADVEKAFGRDVRFSSRVVCGYNFVGIDNGYMQFEGWQLSRLKEEVGKGLPIVLFFHTPLYTPELYDLMMNRREELGLEPHSQWCRRASLCGVPEEYVRRDYTPNDVWSAVPTKETKETVAFINGCDKIKAVFAGHVHCDYETVTESGVPMVITGCETVRLVEIR